MTEEISSKPKVIILKAQDVIDYIDWADYEIERQMIETDLVKKIKGFEEIINRCHKLLIEGKTV